MEEEESMPKIAADGEYLTVLNLFSTDAPEKQESLLSAMREIVDSAAYPGWISSTVHSGVDKPGTANFIQWRSTEDLEARYAGEEFKHRTLPLFGEITTSIRLLQNEVVHTLQNPVLGGETEISPTRDDYTAIEVLQVAEENQADLIDAVGPSQEWLLDVPGFRSNTVLRGLRARGLDGLFVVTYAQWNSKEEYDAYVAVPEADKPAARQKSESRIAALATSRDLNTYRVVHTRSA
jgi:heme-degrading monooxygenase HmoA